MSNYALDYKKNPHNNNIIYCRFCGKRLKWKFVSEHIDYHKIVYCHKDYIDIFEFNPEKGELCVPECYDEIQWTPTGDKTYGVRKCEDCRNTLKECICND